MTSAPHVPVLIGAILERVAPVEGLWVDGTFGAGGYTRALLEAGAAQVVAIDRDPLAFEMAADWAGAYGARLRMEQTTFAEMADVAAQADGVVLDLGVSSMQLDRAERGFSFMKDGPLDMRMSQQGRSAADLVADLDEAALADILFRYGEERASRRIARAIVAERARAPIETTLHLAGIIEGCLPRAKPGQSHPATRSFQALRIAVNEEYRQLTDGLMAAEAVLRPGGLLAVVTFHSVEDRIVKRFFMDRAGRARSISRYAPAQAAPAPAFEIITRKAVGADAAEVAANPRARSARLRIGRRSAAPAGKIEPRALGRPMLAGENP